MSTEEPDTDAKTPASQVPVLANALPDSQKINLTKFDDSRISLIGRWNSNELRQR